jgi:hypothetical protein
MIDTMQHPSSFRDPAGFMFEYQGKFYRQVNQCYAEHYEFFKISGLYDLLVKGKKILPHIEISENFTHKEEWYKTLLPEQLTFISYPYEWCFGQWKDAALLTLELVKKSVEHGMIVKDATPFNIQFIDNRPVFIDTLSFEKYDASKPWIAYRQFVECFIAPLLLAKYHSQELLRIFQVYPGGIPLSVVTRMLPFKSRLNMNVLLHIFLPASIPGNKKTTVKKTAGFTKQKLLNIIQNLESFVQSVQLPSSVSTWNNYYEETVLSNEYVEEKKNIIKEWIKQLTVNTVLDTGTNTGLFAEMAAAEGKFTIAVDADISCIDKLYNTCKAKKIINLLPLYVDITSPSAAIGWDNKERAAFITRIKSDLVLALALVHHLVITSNITLNMLAGFYSRLTQKYLIIEFVPLEDDKVKELLKFKEQYHKPYHCGYFEECFKLFFTIEKKEPVPGTSRILYMMSKKNHLVTG